MHFYNGKVVCFYNNRFEFFVRQKDRPVFVGRSASDILVFCRLLDQQPHLSDGNVSISCICECDRLDALRLRLGKFGLTLEPTKTSWLSLVGLRKDTLANAAETARKLSTSWA